jgi:hypothetical protein
MEGGTPVKQTPVKRKKQERIAKGKQVIDMEASPEDVDIIWKETFQEDTALNFDDPIMREKITSLTNRIVEKVKLKEKQTRQDKAVTRNILKSSVSHIPRSNVNPQRKVC